MTEWVVIDRRNLFHAAIDPAGTPPDFCVRARTPYEVADRGPKVKPFHAPPMLFPTYEAARVHVVAVVDDWCRRRARFQRDYNLAR